MIMDRHMSNALDNFITGHYGADQFCGGDEYDEFVDHTCSNCICASWCPTFKKFCNADEFDECLIIKDVIKRQQVADMEMSAQMERDYERMMDEDCDEFAIEELYHNEQPDELDDLIEQVSWDDKMGS